MWICQGLFPLFQLESLWFHFATSPAILSIFYKIQPNSSQKHRNDAVSQKQLSPRRFSLYFLILSCLKGSTLSLAGAAQRRPSLYTQFTASQFTSKRLSGVLNRFLKDSPLFSSKLPQQVSHLSLAVWPSTTIPCLQQQFSELCTQLVTLQSNFVIRKSSFARGQIVWFGKVSMAQRNDFMYAWIL